MSQLKTLPQVVSRKTGAVVLCFGLALTLTVTEGALAQGAPGYRTRPPAPVPQVGLGGRAGPPRLVGTPPTSVDPRAGRRRFFFPYVFFDGYPLGIYDYNYAEEASAGYSADSAQVREVNPADYSTEVRPAPVAKVQALDDTSAVGRLQVTSEISGGKPRLRLTWPNEHKIAAGQVALFLADSAKKILSAQTIRAAPFTAVFDPDPRTAFTGMTVVLPGGTLATQFIPYKRGK